jgi:hypothetical protein
MLPGLVYSRAGPSIPNQADIAVPYGSSQKLVYSVPQIRREPSHGEATVNLVTGREHLIRERGWRTTAPALPLWLHDHSAQIAEQLEELGFLIGLRGFVGRPILRVGLARKSDRFAI